MDTINSKTEDFKFKRSPLPKMIAEEKTGSKGSEIIYEVDIHLKLRVSSISKDS